MRQLMTKKIKSKRLGNRHNDYKHLRLRFVKILERSLRSVNRPFFDWVQIRLLVYLGAFFCSLRFIKAFFRNDMPDTTTRVLNVTLAPRDQVYMAVKDCLTSNLAAVHADVKTLNAGVV